SMIEPTQSEEVRADGVELAIALTSRSGGHDAAEEALEKAVDDASTEIAEKAARHLVEQGDKSAADTLAERLANLEEDDDKRDLARFLVEHGATVSKSTAESLKESEDDELTQLGWQLHAIIDGDAIFDELEKKFGSTNYDDRLIAVKALGHIDRPGAYKMLEKGLFEGRAEFRKESIEGLKRLAHPRTIPALKKALNDEQDKEVLLKVIDAISRIDDDQSLNLLRFKTTTNDREVKMAIIKAIRRLGDPDGVRPLRVMSQDRNLDIRWEAFLTTLELDRERGLSQLDSQLRNPPEGFMSDIEELDAPVRDEVIAHVLENGDSDARGAALATARTVVESQFDTYRKLAEDSQAPENVRREALLALIERNDKEDLSTFEEVAGDSRAKKIARLAAWTLAARGGEDQEDAFEELSESDDEALKAILAWGVANVHAGKTRQAQQ
ncbi:MAG: HEAT repeat domain-containing protein, partial [Persicimonas sp.]